ncbi:hypothetical protein M404DRAFT_997506 [Pisolithus tinctorius Marx 270]|uniref:Uncharacterized protein n=1 Tax=Pisolithus tinctorius Marx 270 TaxID=870435 RepID=A0A0C3PK48_PISTI|nr:hypothetical protein M404DRAFT_997506 [Pisolithus tinctorius Marx 270]
MLLQVGEDRREIVLEMMETMSLDVVGDNQRVTQDQARTGPCVIVMVVNVPQSYTGRVTKNDPHLRCEEQLVGFTRKVPLSQGNTSLVSLVIG